jgi:hypothetical protein
MDVKNKVYVQPMPERYRKTPMRLRPGIPPIFPGCGPEGPTEEMKQLARALFKLLDRESQEWYLSGGSRLFGDLEKSKN